MKKMSHGEHHVPILNGVKYLFKVKLIAALLVGVTASSMANVTKGQNLVSFRYANTNLKSLLTAIEEQSNVTFMYSDNLVNTIKVQDVNISTSNWKKILSPLLLANNLEMEELAKNRVLIKKINEDQDVRVSGIVKDAEGNTISGVSIRENGTNNSTSTDEQGKFSLKVSSTTATLQVSYVGYITQEIKASSSILNIVLQTDMNQLDEVIIVGYGSSTKKSLVSSVSTVDTKDFAKLPTPNVTQNLAGRTPGLVVQSGSGLNAKSTISIRGGGDPIYVIDGVIRSSNDFANLNSDDIESISVLKDASSTAVYGARAANGIIQVKTKSGSEGNAQVSYSLNQSFSQPTYWAKRVSSYQNALIINEARINEGLDPQFSAEVLEKYRTGSDPGQYANTDWRKAILKNWAPATRHNLSVTGGSETNTYYTSVGYTDMNSLFKSGRYNVDRVNFNLSNTVKVKPIGLSVTGQLSGFVEASDDVYTSEGGGNGYIIQQVGMKAPDEIAFNKYGLPYDVANNPAADASQDAGYMKGKSTVLNGLLNAEWNLPWVDGLKLRGTANYNWYDSSSKNWRKDAAKYAWDSTSPLYAANPQLGIGNTQGLRYTLQYFAQYDKVFGDHSVNALAGYEASYGKSKSMGLNRYNYALPIDQISFGPTDNMDNSASESESGRAGYIGQLKYGYKNRYFLEGSMRRDASDLFPKNNRWGNFFALSAGWVVSDEDFFSSIKERNIFNQLKLRGSVGEVGMDNGIGSFTYLDMYNYSATGYVYDGKMYPTLYEGATPSVNITWYKDTQYDLGFDFESLGGKLYGAFDYFLFVTTGYMADPDPTQYGYIDPYGRGVPQIESDGEKRRGGFDFQIGYRSKVGDFKYDIGFNMTRYDIFWSNYPFESLDTKKNPYTRQTGQYEHFSQVGYHYVKTAESAYEWMNYPQRQGSTNLSGGDFIYEDFNGDGRLTGDDQYRIGYSTKPLINFGIPMNFEYKGFNLNLLFQGAGKRDLPITRTFWDYNYLSRYDYQLDYWTPANLDAKFPRILSAQSVNGSNNLMPSEAWTFNGSYIRLKSVVLGYDLKSSVLAKSKWLRTCNISLTAQNLFTISEATKYGIDPEISNVMSSYPVERVVGFNLNLGF